MSRISTIAFWLSLMLCLVAWADVGGKISKGKGRNKKHTKFDFNQIKINLDGEESFSTYVYPNGVFKFTNVPAGRYILTVDDIDHFFDPIAVEVVRKGDKEGVRAFKYDSKNGKGKNIKHPVYIVPQAPKQYYEIKQPFNILDLFKNPMAIMTIVSLGLVFMMNKMPKPSKEEMEAMGNMGGLASLMGGGS